MSNYPNTNLSLDLPDDPYGGVPANKFGKPARQFIDNVLQFLGRAYLDCVRVPYTIEVHTMGDAVQVGSVAVISLESIGPDGAMWVGPYDSGRGSNRWLGVCLESVGAGAKCKVAVAGIIPRAIAGVLPTGLVENLTVDRVGSGHLIVAGGGDPLVGEMDTQGNVFILPRDVVL